MGGAEGGDAPASTGVEVIPDEVRAVGSLISQAAHELRTELRTVGSEVDSLLDTDGTGPAASRFTAGWTETHDSGLGILSALTDLAEKLGLATNIYESVDDASGTRFTNLNM